MFLKVLNLRLLHFIIESSIFFSFTLMTPAFADDLISLFPIQDYSQSITNWINPNNPNYNELLLTSSQQQARMQEFYNHYFASDAQGLSPWSSVYVNSILQQQPPNNIQSIEQSLLSWFSNQSKPTNEIGYGENFRPHTTEWIAGIENNMNLSQFNLPYNYQDTARGIAVINLAARALPTDDPHFYSYQLPGQGYPFDNLQMSAIWAGTPVYVIGKTADGSWDLVLTPDLIAWVHSEGIAYTDDTFISQWQGMAVHQLAAIIKTQTPMSDAKNDTLRFLAYVGSVFPFVGRTEQDMTLMIPERDTNGQAEISSAIVSREAATLMPFTPTPHDFSILMATLQERPYGWGGYNFYNDCSAETKSLFTPFGIYLPRHSSDQMSAGTMVDASAQDINGRINYLTEQGHPFMTIVYIGGHVFLYIGNYITPFSAEIVPMTYQNLWGLSPADGSRRSVIGESVFFPLLIQYPEDPTLQSLADHKYFQVSFLDEMPSKVEIAVTKLNLRSLMLPENSNYQ